MNITIQFFQAGSCQHPEFTLIRGGKIKPIDIPAIFALISHPQQGYILFDTGYSQRFFQATEKLPAKLYSMVTPVTLNPQQTAVRQLESQQISARDIKYIILSHFHADHIGGLKDFPQAKFICSQGGYQAVVNKRGLTAVRAGFLPALLPDDFLDRAWFLETLEEIDLPAKYHPFDRGFDLWGDASISIVPLPGHAIGQLGAILTDKQGITYFLIADACWLSRAYQELIMPHPIVNLIMPDRDRYRDTLQKIHQLHHQQPDIKIVPTHCRKTWNQISRKS